MAELSNNVRAIHPRHRGKRELSIWEGWDPVPEWDGYPPLEEDGLGQVSHHHASMRGKIAALALDGDVDAARFEFGGY